MEAPTFEHIEPAFTELRDFVLNDLNLIVSQLKGGNYAATALVSSTYEELARLQGQEKHTAFEAQLPEQWRPVAKSLYGALRNGLIHHYDPKVIVVDERRIELAISWRNEPHLSLRAGRLYLNVQQLAADLASAFENYERELRADPALRERLCDRVRKGREQNVPSQSREAEAWRVLLAADG